MAKKLSKAQIQPIINILNMKKNKELELVINGKLNKEIIEVEKSNEILAIPLARKRSIIDSLIKEYNIEVAELNNKLGIEGYSNLFPAINSITNQVIFHRSYTIDNTHKSFKVSLNQFNELMQKQNQAKEEIIMKYEIIMAKILLSEDFAGIESVLNTYGISLEDNGDSKEPLPFN